MSTLLVIILVMVIWIFLASFVYEIVPRIFKDMINDDLDEEGLDVLICVGCVFSPFATAAILGYYLSLIFRSKLNPYINQMVNKIDKMKGE